MLDSKQVAQAQVEATTEAVRRRIGREIALPFMVAFLILIALVVLVMVTAGAGGQTERIGIVSNMLLCILILLPMALCLFPLYVLLVVSVFGLERLTGRIATPLQKVEAITVRMQLGAERISKTLATQAIRFGAAGARVERLINVFERKPQLPPTVSTITPATRPSEPPPPTQ